MDRMSVKKICEKIWELEDKYNLLYKEIQGVKVWQHLRMNIYYEIAQKTGVFNKPHGSKDGLLDKFKAIPSYLYNAILRNPLKGNYQKDILVFDHARKKLIDGEYIDIYTKYLLDDIEDSKYDVIEDSYLRKHWSRSEKNRKYLDYLSISSYLPKRLYKLKFNDDEIKFINKLQNEINDFFNINLDLTNVFSRGIKNFKYNYKFYDKLIKKRKPKKIYVLISYARSELICAAKENNVQVIEIQHGVISPYHLGYNFPNYKNGNNELEYFPNKLYSFGDYWGQTIDFPLKKENIIAYGFPYMNERKNKYNNLKKNKNQILFISQGVIGKELSKFAYKVAKKLNNYKIIYKLHPGEYDRWKEEYQELLHASELDNVEVVDNNQKDLYSYFAESEYQIGVFSTAIYEGLAFDCKTLLVDLPGIEYMKYLIGKDIVKKIDNINQLEECINNFNISCYDKEYFFKGI